MMTVTMAKDTQMRLYPDYRYMIQMLLTITLWLMPTGVRAEENSQPAQPPSVRNRRDFAQQMARIKKRMDSEQVLAILGKPDDVHTREDPGGISTGRIEEIWCYGTAGHLTFPTLGCIYMDDQGKAQDIYGGKGTSPVNGSGMQFPPTACNP
jgi:hypothetical protein